MDIDVMAKHIPALMEFKKRVEALLDGAEAGSATAAEVLGNQISDLRKELADLGEHVTAIQLAHDAAATLLTDITGMRDWFIQNCEGLDVLLSIGDGLKTAVDVGSSTAAPTLTLDQIDAATKPQVQPVAIPDALTPDPIVAKDAGSDAQKPEAAATEPAGS